MAVGHSSFFVVVFNGTRGFLLLEENLRRKISFKIIIKHKKFTFQTAEVL